MPHFRAAFNLARWLTRNEQDAQDVVQEAYLRAFRFFDGWNGTSARLWLLTIVRHTTYSWLQKNRSPEVGTIFDEQVHTPEDAPPLSPGEDPEAALLRTAQAKLLNEGLSALPIEFREVLVLRELEGLSYKEIADITHVPLGTVMSRLSRARQQLQRWLIPRIGQRQES